MGRAYLLGHTSLSKIVGHCEQAVRPFGRLFMLCRVWPRLSMQFRERAGFRFPFFCHPFCVLVATDVVCIMGRKPAPPARPTRSSIATGGTPRVWSVLLCCCFCFHRSFRLLTSVHSSSAPNAPKSSSASSSSSACSCACTSPPCVWTPPIACWNS